MDFRAALLEQTRAFGDLIKSGDRDTPVPTCGDWTLEKLFRHVGRGNRWAAQIIIDRRNEPLDPRDVPDGRPPDESFRLLPEVFHLEDQLPAGPAGPASPATASPARPNESQ